MFVGSASVVKFLGDVLEDPRWIVLRRVDAKAFAYIYRASPRPYQEGKRTDLSSC